MTVSFLRYVEPAPLTEVQHRMVQPCNRRTLAQANVGHGLHAVEQREVYVRSRRLPFLLRAAYWSLRHRSLSSGVWVANFEGYSWN